ncbi:MAG: alpha/beta hydrolase [Anaerolineae bacterium]|jgi:pimeloyl-ACP methyl ester carboxylesterase|nr:MAG: alpha/beta hydrolase [Anaerolineae bacterium]MCL4880130.1 alpha/beta hydrolase [Anaerolineae bacterium]
MAIERTVVYKIDDQAIHVKEEGPADRQVALFIHGWSSSWYALSPIFQEFNRRYRVMAVDLPGYGESPRMKERATIPAYADLLAKLIREVTDKPIVLIGHSMGGMISLTLTLRHPELVERMILICPTISGKLSMFINMFVSPITFLERSVITNRFISAFEPYFIQITDRLMRPASFADRTEIKEDEYTHLRADARRPGQGRVRAECYRAMRENDLRGKLSQVNKPALVIWGMEDNTVPLRDASVVATEWPDADLRMIPNAGHWPQFETPVITRRYVKAFMGTPVKLLNLEF